MDEVIDRRAKLRLYRNPPETERVRSTVRSDRGRRLRGLGPKKAKRFARQVGTAYDRIPIGSRIETRTETA